MLGGDDVEEFIAQIISNIGVPAAICFYTLFGVNKTLKELTDAINRMSADVKKINDLEREIEELKFKVAHLQWKE